MIRMIMSTLLLALCVTVVAGCGSINFIHNLDERSDYYFAPETHGVLVSSSSFSGTFPEGTKEGWAKKNKRFRCSFYQLVYKKVGAEVETRGNLSAIPDGGLSWNEGDPSDFLVADGQGFVTATILPAGEYEIFMYNAMCGLTHYFSDEYSILFEVKPGVINYAGELAY